MGARMRYMRAATMTCFAQAARSLGLDPLRMLREVGLPPLVLEDPELKVPADSLSDLLEAAAAASGREDFGLLMGQFYKISMMGPLGLLVREQPTVGAAMATFARHQDQQSDCLDFLIETQGDLVLYVIESRLGGSRPHRELREFIVTAALRTLRHFLGETWRPEVACFAHGRPTDLSSYRRMFGAAEFDHGFDGLVVEAAVLATPIPTADPDMARNLMRFFERPVAVREQAMGERVAELIRRLLPTGACTIDRVAQHMGMDRRTVHRRLAAEGICFTDLMERTRRELVMAQIRHSDRPLTVLADMLGFSSLSTFSRWFRQAYGQPASQFRLAA